MEDIGADACKTGMLANEDIVQAVTECLRNLQPPNLVVDPVLRAQGGDSLLEPDAETAVRDELLPLSRVVTPNLAEAAALYGEELETVDEMKEAAAAIADMGPRWALVKGGHLSGEPVDILSDGKDTVEIRRPRVHTTNTHGTGCTYSAAIASRLARGLSPRAAVRKARDDLQKGLEASLSLGAGSGPLNHYAMFEPPAGDTP